ncbi:hypothetical protein [Mesorhizobium sp.]|uniref:hypothetical protein n=1 Tax=Mesorhizobium sp. TaxID=1871066 RepID=UPI000FE5C312|nr:hypothetical protein [Mesorhizobium sp.]RWE96489.1 MAG: hypothetical protein EOS43_22585 [Mesorhizobium sp.]
MTDPLVNPAFADMKGGDNWGSCAMWFWKSIKRQFMAVDLSYVYVPLRGAWSFRFFIKLDRANDKKFVEFKFCHLGAAEALCSLSVEEFNDLVDGVLKVKAELEKPLPTSDTQP